MADFDLDGDRRRYYHERAQNEQAAGNPITTDISVPARERLLREIHEHSRTNVPGRGFVQTFEGLIKASCRIWGFSLRDYDQTLHLIPKLSIGQFLGFLELAADHIVANTTPRESEVGLKTLQSILKDDLCCYRYRPIAKGRVVEWQIFHIDNEHLHKEIVDRTFELTRQAEFAAAQKDYADAWKHYTKGDLDDAVTNAGRGVESAAKTILARLEPGYEVAGKKLNQMVPKMEALKILPSETQNLAQSLAALIQHSGSLRNQDGIAHGAAELVDPDVAVALLALRLSGTLISFLCARYEQMKSAGLFKA